MTEPFSREGVLRCSRYAFGPNRLHYCGPDANSELLAYLTEGATDAGLTSLLRAFQTMYPYLCHIATSNAIRDPFDERVVEAYWIGNNLLDRVETKKFYQHLIDEHKIKKRLDGASFSIVTDALRNGAVPHHSFHVFDIWKRTGNNDQPHTLESMDACRISWGTIERIDGPFITVRTEPLVLRNKKLAFGSPISKRIATNLTAPFDIEQASIGDILSFHWETPCEVITRAQTAMLKKYTLRHIRLANMRL